MTIQGMLCAVEQCTACDNYRAKNIEDAPYIGPDASSSSSEPTDEASEAESVDDEGW